MGKYLPGQPSIIAQHMPGAGSLIAASYIKTNAARGLRVRAHEPHDGDRAAARHQNAKFDACRFSWLGPANSRPAEHLLAYGAGQIIEDTFTQTLSSGAPSPAAQETLSEAFNELLGTRSRSSPDYPGSTEILLAIERGEVQGFCGIGWTFVKLRKGDWLRDKKINILFQMALAKHPDIPDVPAILDFAQEQGGSAGHRVPARAAGDGSAVLRAAAACRRNGSRRCAALSRRR